ncbi:16S rRNA (cytosine(1402)-N(4))-methyltransferase RsmH [Parenemella sanctibonifatiensis]|uniref:Ribosomal RNA small subunit methyltransferase H n=1 Tax=Parenemella sanctibonifatiensis TaxID=2016505 RepID=A0A255EE54_9ACTN|nr:16S rRNA (cytosine(1402)-N(4))-methyltransferase RsmH [Parenemella sanctibonifatiensis]OYN89826.1 16S rRNA (cytosine(1402)-N(4))-methyltransferase [Parenemella sanctibonifatiensis]
MAASDHRSDDVAGCPDALLHSAPPESDSAREPGAQHVPVMAQRCLELLAPALTEGNPIYVDATLGLAGHASLVLDSCPRAHLIGIDRDPRALDIAAERLARFGDRVELHQAVYDEIPEVLEGRQVQGILMDLGLSSMQIDRTERGFAYAVDAPLDMRMGEEGPTAADLLNDLGRGELVRLLRRYGDERFADRIVSSVLRVRADHRIERSGELVDIIRGAVPVAAQQGGHPAKKTFQALRIAVNDELAVLERALPAAIDALAPRGRLVVMAYHSGEDRLVKNELRDQAADRAPRGMPIVPPELRARLTLLTKGAERPTDEEVAANPRAASVRLRAAERLEEAA